jgi:uncharacterized protein (TIGR02145 family)
MGGEDCDIDSVPTNCYVYDSITGCYVEDGFYLTGAGDFIIQVEDGMLIIPDVCFCFTTTTTTTEEITTTTTTTTIFGDCEEYGLLYNWYAITDTRNIAAGGWHISTLAEYNTLISYLGGDLVAGGKMKETGYVYWSPPNTGATNSSGFNARGAGYRDNYGDFSAFNELWGTIVPELNESFYVLTKSIVFDDEIIYESSDNLTIGVPIRLIKNNSIKENYIGNDGKVYNAVKIGTQVWMAGNLAETEYADHSPICEVQDSTEWSNLTTGAMCAYNNDYDNVGCGFSGGTQCTTTTTTTSP